MIVDQSTDLAQFKSARVTINFGRSALIADIHHARAQLEIEEGRRD